jgi:hypothetical protein
VSSGDRIPGGLRPVCCGSRARRRVRVARWRRVVGGCRPPVPPVGSVPAPAPGLLFGVRRARLFAVLAVVYGLLVVWWFAPVPVASVAAGFAVLGFGWLLVAELFSSPGGVR